MIVNSGDNVANATTFNGASMMANATALTNARMVANVTTLMKTAGGATFRVQYEFLHMWLIIIAILSIAMITVFGNCIVLVAFISNRSLRKVSNSFIMSLASVDALIGCILPLRMFEMIYGQWIWSAETCQAMLLVENALSNTSMLNILLISLDRWWCVHRPFQYRVRQTKTRAIALIVFSWVLGSFIYVPPMYSWHVVHGEKIAQVFSLTRSCLVPYSGDLSTTLSLSSVTFLIPLIILALCNLSIYLKVSHRKDKKLRRSVSTSDTYYSFVSRKSSADTDTSDSEEAIGTSRTKTSENDRGKDCTKAKYVMLVRNSSTPGDLCRYSRRYSPRRVSFDAGVVSGIEDKRQNRYSRRFSVSSNNSTNSTTNNSDDIVKSILTKQDKKAARLLGLLVCVFIMCWVPKVVCSIINAYHHGAIPKYIKILHIAQWLQWLNSGINPFLYANSNTKFRRVIRNWIGIPPEDRPTPLFYELYRTFPKVLNFISENQSDQQSNTSTLRAMS
ncbi:unnamed protein product [Owenia fusiformis]|uniref:Uncharacterized protein n=1 Tax=Owenia fusiformis TaxID=6347 RepID=A0A8J1Y9B3_OWEFU|nr:unnamed protein product [Owenia fusiformis]